jgi:hypothetical protein
MRLPRGSLFQLSLGSEATVPIWIQALGNSRLGKLNTKKLNDLPIKRDNPSPTLPKINLMSFTVPASTSKPSFLIQVICCKSQKLCLRKKPFWSSVPICAQNPNTQKRHNRVHPNPLSPKTPICCTSQKSMCLTTAFPPSESPISRRLTSHV